MVPISQSLNVIALISGGKDSIHSILHCLKNGHKVVALGNLYPLNSQYDNGLESDSNVDERDLNSFMYQTVGHTVIPLYEQALELPLYRHPILGSAVQADISYQVSTDGVDETESLVPLLKKIMTAHPNANAVSTGAIYSTYQRTRIESVAIRLGLESLSFLWEYPVLPPGSQISLLQDMTAVQLDARIIKVASGGLDESFLWQNIASGDCMRRVEKVMARFGMSESGAVLGEGGEFETLVLDGPPHLFKRRIVVAENDIEVIREGGGTAWAKIKKASVLEKGDQARRRVGVLRLPDLLESRFLGTIWALDDQFEDQNTLLAKSSSSYDVDEAHDTLASTLALKTSRDGELGQNWTVVSCNQFENDIEQEAGDIIDQIKALLSDSRLETTDIISTVIILRSMRDFAIVNKIYGALFKKPNPPARVTIACGNVLPGRYNVVIHLRLFKNPEIGYMRKALHVQSRSYWAPANIGPYSQAQSIPVKRASESGNEISLVYIAGQIPLIPQTMNLAKEDDLTRYLAEPWQGLHPKFELGDFMGQTVLSLQHLWRVGRTMEVAWFTGAVAYLSRDTHSNVALKAKVAGFAWEHQNNLTRPMDEAGDDDLLNEGVRDLWEERHHGGIRTRGSTKISKELPSWSIIQSRQNMAMSTPPFFAAEVEELPRGSDIEWHALLGLTDGPIEVDCYPEPGVGTAYRCVIASHIACTIVHLPYQPEISNIDQVLDELMSKVETTTETARRKNRTGYYHSYASYLDACVRGLWDADSYGGMIPCRSLWDKNGERLAAVLLFQTSLEEFEPA